MARTFKELLTQFTKKLKSFRKIYKKDSDKAIELAHEIIADSKEIEKHKECDERNKKEMLKARDSMQTYMDLLKQVDEFKKKWQK